GSDSPGCEAEQYPCSMLALLGIAHRKIQAKREPDQGITQHRKVFPKEVKTLGDFLRKARSEHALNQRQLAARLQISRNLIQDWERDASIPSTEDWTELVSVLPCLLTALESLRQ